MGIRETKHPSKGGLPFLRDGSVEAVAFLRTLPQLASGPRRVFHSEVYGSYMIWALSETRVFVDTRIELYPEEQWRDYLALNRARHDWQAVLERYDVDTLLLERGKQEQLIEAATLSSTWRSIYQDDQAAILERWMKP